MQKSSIQYILKLSIPIFFANLAIPMVGIIDTALMGNLGSLSYLSATSVAANLFSMIFWSFGFLRMGTVGMVSQANGRNNYTEILNIVVRNLLFVLAISITIILLQNLILSLSLKIFDLSEATRNLYEQYFKIRVYSAPGELTLYIITGLFVGLQKTKTSSLAVGFFSILNILLSIVLVTKFDLNIKGVAYGTLFSALITSIIFLIYMFWYLSKYTKITINFAQIFNLKKIKNIFNINLNIFIRTILLTFSFLWFTYLGTQIGENYVAANAILINLVFLSAFILDAYAFSTEGIVGYSLGKKDLNLFKNIVKNSFILSSISGLIISIIFFFTNNLVINLMSDINEIRELSSSYAVWLIILPVISSFCYQFDGIFIGASQTKELRNAMIFSVFSYLLISILLIKFLFNTGIWISLCIFMILRAVSLFYYLDKIYLRFRKN
ncbi:MATE family efflux transporter [Candidatus Pelagibacter bacterium]|nr:MATE family efflux transporter [Candidatus Pelagibacter bacterium]MDA9933111.1 MATE family efflux transporter [Candidatus Pelagibacter sp.]MDB2545371.1 MATE family efflux transporter [Candidatus Pelagibacter bacterium]MDB3919346.1 MATE family efflux transporter [Candidatus Pelagibacter sp.]MDB3987548.1 MATE family efflux transporter [Candidatus Pelagibacter sp.]|tara:strand:+ start:468 stop:1784 length:1317 start_codon:yes stop_codon:yes gene_type:complete